MTTLQQDRPLTDDQMNRVDKWLVSYSATSKYVAVVVTAILGVQVIDFTYQVLASNWVIG